MRVPRGRGSRRAAPGGRSDTGVPVEENRTPSPSTAEVRLRRPRSWSDAQVVDPLGDGERDDAGRKSRRDHEPAPGDRQAARRDEEVEGRLGGSQVAAEEARGRGHQREEEDGNGEPERKRDRGPGPAAGQPRQTHEREREQHERPSGAARGKGVQCLLGHRAARRRAQAAALEAHVVAGPERCERVRIRRGDATATAAPGHASRRSARGRRSATIRPVPAASAQ